MRLSKKAAIGFLIIVLVEITSRQCMPRNKNTIPFQTNKRLQRIAMYTPNTSNSLTKTNKSTSDKPQNKYSTNLLNKLIKEAKTKYGEKTKAEIEQTSPFSKPFTPGPQPFCFKDFGTFPEVEYPMFVTDTWSPNYWNQLPNLQQKQPMAITTYETPNYIKPSDKSIDKAIRALIKLRDKNKDGKPTSSIPEEDVCPLEPPSQCLPSEQSNVYNATTGSTDKTSPVIPVPTQSSLCDDCETPGSTTTSPLPEDDTSQLPFPKSVTPEYTDNFLSTATTAMPPSSISSSKVDNEDCGDSGPETGSAMSIIESPVSLTDEYSTKIFHYPAGESNNSTDALTFNKVPVLPTGGLSNPIENQKEPLKPAEELVPPSVHNTSSTGSLSDLPKDKAIEEMPPAILDSDTNDMNQQDTTAEALPSEEPYVDDILGSNYEFATVPPDDVSFDTSPTHLDPDDKTSKLSPGDTDYILA